MEVNVEASKTRPIKKAKMTWRKLRLSLKFRPDIYRFIMKMKKNIYHKKILISKLKAQLKSLTKSDIEKSDSTTQTDLDIETIAIGDVNKTNNSKPRSNIEPSEEKGWKTKTHSGEKEKSIADQVKEAAQSALQQSGMVYVESAGMYYDYKTGYYYNSELGLYYHTDTGCYYYYSDEKQSFVFHSYPDRSQIATNAAFEAHERKKARKQKREQKKEDDVDNLTKTLSQDKEEDRSKPKRRKVSKKKEKKRKDTDDSARDAKDSKDSTKDAKESIKNINESNQDTKGSTKAFMDMTKESTGMTKESTDVTKESIDVPNDSMDVDKDTNNPKQDNKDSSMGTEDLKEEPKDSAKVSDDSEEITKDPTENIKDSTKDSIDSTKDTKYEKIENGLQDKEENDKHIDKEKEDISREEREKKEDEKDQLEDGECSETESEEEDEVIEVSDASTATASDDESIAKHHPPCMRVIVRETKLPKLKVGTLFLVTKDGGTVGREGDQHTIVIRDTNVSRTHLEIRYDAKRNTYVATDLGSKNGTVLNGTRMSESQIVSKPLDVMHGSTIELGETKLLCHIHPGTDTCGHCEPGLIMETYEKQKGVAYTRTCSKEKQHQLELARLKNKYAPKQLAIEETAYNDRAQSRRETVGSSHPAEKTVSADAETFIAPDNKGFKLLEKMGWSKGEGLGKDSQGDVEPIPLVSNEGKLGLGSTAPAPMPLKINPLAKATIHLASRSKLLKPPAKAFQNPLDDSDGE